MISAKVIEDSISEDGKRLTTLQLCYPRFVHAELMTHRVFSRNASSSRAIPVAKMLEQVRNNPAVPLYWGANQKGMQAGEEVSEAVKEAARRAWLDAANHAADHAELLMRLGLHKQVCNRLLEPFQLIHVVITATEWDNFFELRDHPAAEPHMQLLARTIKKAMAESEPILRKRDRYTQAGWHLPYITGDERLVMYHQPFKLALISTARCARVSYMKHDGTEPDIDEDLDLAMRLVGQRPMHASPSEHQAYPAPSADTQSGNFRGWMQHRKWLEAEMRQKRAA